MKKMQIFEPSMCCSTGLCGVGVDQELLRITTVLNSLKNHGVNVDRFNLTNSPQEFVKNELVNHFINEKGVEGLPASVVDGEIVISGRYPTNDEFVKLLSIPRSYLGEKPSEVKASSQKSEDCGCSGGGCDCSGGDCCC